MAAALAARGASGREEIVALTALRGAAAWWVVAYHMRELVPPGTLGGAFVHRGSFAVDLFFVLSGFVIGLAYGDVFARGCGVRDHARFLGLRLARVYPVHLVMLGLFLTVPLALVATGREVDGCRYSGEAFVQSALLVQNWGWGRCFVWNVPAWSISTELAAYLVFPWVAAALVRAGRGGGVALATAGLGLLLLCWGLGEVTGGLARNTPRYGLWRCLSECALGTWVWVAAGRWRVPSMALLVGSAALALAYALGAASAQAALPGCFGLLVWGLSQTRPAAGGLGWRALLWLGEVSFSTYMVHFLVREWVRMGLLGRVPDGVVVGAYLGLVLLASAALHAVVERPGRRWGRAAVARWTRPAGALAGGGA